MRLAISGQTEQLIDLANALEDPETRLLWDFQSMRALSFVKLCLVLKQVYCCEGQAKIFNPEASIRLRKSRYQLILMRRKKCESLTDLDMDIKRLVVTTIPDPPDRITEVVAWNVFFNAFQDRELFVQIQDGPASGRLGTGRECGSEYGSVDAFDGRESKPIRAVTQEGNEPGCMRWRDLREGKIYILETVHEIGRRVNQRMDQKERC